MKNLSAPLSQPRVYHTTTARRLLNLAKPWAAVASISVVGAGVLYATVRQRNALDKLYLFELGGFGKRVLLTDDSRLA